MHERIENTLAVGTHTYEIPLNNILIKWNACKPGLIMHTKDYLHGLQVYRKLKKRQPLKPSKFKEIMIMFRRG